MKGSKKFLSVLFSVLLTASCLVFPASANDSVSETIYFEDGSYLILELSASSALARATRIGERTGSFYNNADELAWVVTVQGTFTYDGTTATATNATYSYQIYDSTWSFKDGSAYCSGNQAISTCSFAGGLFRTRSITVTISCSPTGVLS